MATNSADLQRMFKSTVGADKQSDLTQNFRNIQVLWP